MSAQNSVNLLKSEWANINSDELLILCRDQIAFGQLDRAGSKNTIYFPQARKSCEFSIKFDGGKVLEINPGNFL